MPSFADPLLIPGYEILEKLGEGGMGVVYKARQVRANRVVALKMIRGLLTEQDRARFRIEAESVARLKHDHIVQIYEIGEHQDRPYFSLEFCAGGSLAERLQGGPLPPQEAAQLVEALARAMEAAHCKHVVHRDLKPGNVLLDEEGQPKISDFGLAKRMDEESGLTQTDAVMGTPSYMAPEQAEGKKTVGPLADVYALGAILYECLTGRPPFKGVSFLDTLEQVRRQDASSPRQLRREVPRDLETICLHCLKKDSAKRYNSAEDLAEDLRRFQNGEAVRVRRAGSLARTWRWLKQGPILASLIMNVMVLLILGIVLYVVYDALIVQRREMVEAQDSVIAVQVAGQIDESLRYYQKQARKWASAETVIKHLSKPPGERNRDEALRFHASLEQRVREDSDKGLAAMAMLDASGRATLTGNKDLILMDLSFSRIIRAALLSGVGGIGDVLFIPLFPGRPAEAVIPVIEPIKDKQGRMVGLATLWVKAKTVEDIVKKGTVLGGQGSSFMVLDRHGIRIAHSVPEKVLYRPTGPLPDADRRRMVAEQRFGPDTKECLAKVLAFPEVYERAAAENPDTRMFEGQSGSNDEVYVGMGRRLETVPWTVFLMHPGGDVNQPVIAVFRKVAVWCVPVVLLGLGIGGLVLRGTLRDRRGRSGGLRS